MRGIVGYIKNLLAYKNPKFDVIYFFGMCFLSGIVGVLVSAASGYELPALSFIVGYAGGDFAEGVFKILLKKKELQKGVSLYLSIIIMTVLLVMVFGLTVILQTQFKMVEASEKAVAALYAADAGIETVLVTVIHDAGAPQATYDSMPPLDNGATYHVEVKCSVTNTTNCPAGLTNDPNCSAQLYCINSLGTYKGTTRAVSVKYW